eukprot:SAG31_NODE_3681_length_3992_cov_89.507835_3_plen_87_part_00
MQTCQWHLGIRLVNHLACHRPTMHCQSMVRCPALRVVAMVLRKRQKWAQSLASRRRLKQWLYQAPHRYLFLVEEKWRKGSKPLWTS